MNLNHYVFHSVWQVQAPSVDVISVISDLETYPAWWPEIHDVRRLGDNRFAVVARSLLPYALRFVLEAAPGPPTPRVVDGRLSGDLEGSVRWSVEEHDGGCRLVYDQQVTTHKRLLNTTAPVARPAFRANHGLMMRHGEAGLRTFMAGFARGAAHGGRRAS